MGENLQVALLLLGAVALIALLLLGWMKWNALRKRKEEDPFFEEKKDGEDGASFSWLEIEKGSSTGDPTGDAAKKGSSVRYSGSKKEDKKKEKNQPPKETEELYFLPQTDRETLGCPVCGVENDGGRDYCSLCGAHLK